MLTILEARHRTGLSRKRAAVFLGVTEQTVYRWETGRTQVKRFHLAALADLYGVRPEDLGTNGQAV